MTFDSLLRTDLPIGCEIIGYADDALILVKGHDLKRTESQANQCLIKIATWSEENKLEFNTSKTTGVIFTRKQKPQRIDIKFKGQRISLEKELKYLGLIFDQRLTWNSQMTQVISRGKRLINALPAMARNTWGMGHDTVATIYKGAILPLLTYGTSVFGEALKRKVNVKRLRSLQRIVSLRIIKGYRTVSYEAATILSDLLPIEEVMRNTAKIEKTKYEVKHTAMNSDIEKPDLFTLRHPSVIVKIIDATPNTEVTSIYTDGSKV